MKRIILATCFLTLGIWNATVCISSVMAQTDDEFILEEIVVTSEKRETNVQKIAGSVVVEAGEDLLMQGRITTSQILETVPNVRFGGTVDATETTAANPNGVIAIRGVSYKQTSDGQPPPATATYVDGVFQGIGGNYDIDRVEVLRGPQGTLYGRSATGGVVAFHTKDPKLSQFSGGASLETGEASLINVQGAVNVPVGDAFAVRAAAHFYERDGYHNPEGGWRQTKEGRIKALYQPSDALDIMLSGSITDEKTASGGYNARLDENSPDTILYKDTVTSVIESGTKRSAQGSLTVNYDFGGSILTYIGAVHTYKDEDSPGELRVLPGILIHLNEKVNKGETFHTEEIRLASDTDGRFKWLVGSNYYYGDYERTTAGIQKKAYIPGGLEDPDPNTVDAIGAGGQVDGDVTNLSFFTEESFDLRDDFRVTLGLRYDMTTLDSFAGTWVNCNVNEYGNSLNPADMREFSLKDDIDYDNVTYKLRLEYDVTPDSMLYALTSTGFQPGDIRLNRKMYFDDDGNVADILFFAVPYEEEKLTSYEIGSKNRFLGNRLQMNASAFYYDYEGFQQSVNISAMGAPEYVPVPLPIEMYGAELDMTWLITEKDILSSSVGLLHTEITDYPYIEAGEEMISSKKYIAMESLPNCPDMTATIAYSHLFTLANGSSLTPRMELRYTSGTYLENLTESQVDAGLKPFAYQDDYVIMDIGAAWSSPTGRYSLTGYVRNVADEEYKAAADIGSNTYSNGVTPGDSRVWGLLVSAKF